MAPDDVEIDEKVFDKPDEADGIESIELELAMGMLCG
jgi:hypothetical protein